VAGSTGSAVGRVREAIAGADIVAMSDGMGIPIWNGKMGIKREIFVTC
jgi:hypothetical protein